MTATNQAMPATAAPPAATRSGGWTVSLERWRAALPAAALHAAGGAAVLALKLFGRGADAERLRVVLGPTCLLAGRLGGIAFTDEGAAGFISHAEHLVVGSACSGWNFLIVTFAALFFSFVHRPRQTRARWAWLPASLALAWAATVVTNAVRVVLAAQLYGMTFYGATLTPARVHRLLGVALYCASVVALHGAVGRWFAVRGAANPARGGWRGGPRGARLLRSPLTWYVGIAVVLPLLRRCPQGLDARLLEHSVVVACVVLLAIGMRAIARRFADRLQSTPSQPPE